MMEHPTAIANINLLFTNFRGVYLITRGTVGTYGVVAQNYVFKAANLGCAYISPYEVRRHPEWFSFF